MRVRRKVARKGGGLRNGSCRHRLGYSVCRGRRRFLHIVRPVRCKHVAAERKTSLVRGQPSQISAKAAKMTAPGLQTMLHLSGHPPPHLQRDISRANSSVHHAVQAAGRKQQVDRSRNGDLL